VFTTQVVAVEAHITEVVGLAAQVAVEPVQVELLLQQQEQSILAEELVLLDIQVVVAQQRLVDPELL
jgi:hypothetical protein